VSFLYNKFHVSILTLIINDMIFTSTSTQNENNENLLRKQHCQCVQKYKEYKLISPM
jgi:hypothetical protein